MATAGMYDPLLHPLSLLGTSAATINPQHHTLTPPPPTLSPSTPLHVTPPHATSDRWRRLLAWCWMMLDSAASLKPGATWCSLLWLLLVVVVVLGTQGRREEGLEGMQQQ